MGKGSKRTMRRKKRREKRKARGSFFGRLIRRVSAPLAAIASVVPGGGLLGVGLGLAGDASARRQAKRDERNAQSTAG